MRAPLTMRASRRVVSLAVLLLACEGRPAPQPEEYLDDDAVQIFEEVEVPDPGSPAPPAIADRAAMPVARRHDRPPPILPTEPDLEHQGRAPVDARRYVYRVRMVVPAGLGDGSDRMALPSAELFVDVSHERLRARFEGAGWPVSSGAEVRLRADRHGVYAFDEAGGRPLPPGGLAAWFEGGPVSRRGPPLRVLTNYGPMRNAPPDESVPGALVCAFLAELSNEPRENVVRKCEGRGAPYLWRLGFWHAEQTADVPISLPRAALRGDEIDPPPRIRSGRGHAFLEPSGLRRISPSREAGSEPGGSGGLQVRNDSATRAIISVEGVAIGSVDAGATRTFRGLRPGSYEVGAIRPLGSVLQRRRQVLVPGTHRVCDGRCPRPAVSVPAPSEPEPSEPEPSEAPEPGEAPEPSEAPEPGEADLGESGSPTGAE